jgi:hypothetical protein
MDCEGACLMNKLISYINLIINEYADKPLDEAYHLDVESIPQNELSTLIEAMLEHDNHLRDIVMSHIQDSIDARLPNFEINHRYWPEAI